MMAGAVFAARAFFAGVCTWPSAFDQKRRGQNKGFCDAALSIFAASI